MDVHNGPVIYNPKSLPELVYIVSKNQNCELLAGGTDLMRKNGFYPNPDQKDLVNLEQIPELSKVFHSERYLEVGSMVTLAQLLSTGSFFLSKSLYKAIDDIGTSIVRNNATIGGALCSQNGRSSLSCYLASIGSFVEIRTALGKKRKGPVSSSKWIPLSKLYQPDGSLDFDSDSFISKIRIPVYDSHSTQIFKTIGSVYKNPSASVVFALVYSVNQRRISTPQLFVSFPSGGFFTSEALNESIGNIVLPMTEPVITKTVETLEKDLKEVCPTANEIQIEQTKRLLSEVLHYANSTYLAG